MPSSIVGSGSWKKALLPSLGSRHRDDRPTTRPPRPSSSNTADATENGVAPPIAPDNMDERLVSDLLETTTENDGNSGASIIRLLAQNRHLTRSHTVHATPSSNASSLSGPPQTSHDNGLRVPGIPHKSSKRNLRKMTPDLSVSSSGGYEDGLSRPMSTSQSVSSHLTSRRFRRVAQSSNAVAAKQGSIRFKGDSPIRKGRDSPRRISRSVTSVLSNSKQYHSNASISANSGGPLKTSFSRTKNVFAKFADVLTEHFTAKNSRKVDRPAETIRMAVTSSDTTTHLTVHDQSLNRSSWNPLAVPTRGVTNTMPTSLGGDDEMEKEMVKVKLTPGRARAETSPAKKRLTVVDEVDFQNGQPLEDPFSESSPGQRTTKFEARLKSGQDNRGFPTPTDPFQAEQILESSVDAMLTSPPVGCSTPRRRSLSLSRCETPTQGSRQTDNFNDLISFSPGVSSAEPARRCKIPTPRGVTRKENQPFRDNRTRGFPGRKDPRPGNSASSDSTRLSSYPAGSTIRHVPRSIARLSEAPALPVSAVERARALPLGRKKHPSPSKGQLEVFGKYMEKNLELGVFKDADELGMSFNSPLHGARTLSSRDANRLLRNTSFSNIDLRKDYTAHGNDTALPKARSRIPQPVRQLSRSRTDTAFARDFIPFNKGDSTMEDELQWDASAYKIGHRCNHCGSMNQIV